MTRRIIVNDDAPDASAQAADPVRPPWRADVGNPARLDARARRNWRRAVFVVCGLGGAAGALAAAFFIGQHTRPGPAEVRRQIQVAVRHDRADRTTPASGHHRKNHGGSTSAANSDSRSDAPR